MDTDEAVVRTDNIGMEENFPTSLQPASKPTNATADQMLEILKDDVLEANRAGIKARLSPMWKDGMAHTIIVLENVTLVDGQLVRVV
jgi:hypothetical protein